MSPARSAIAPISEAELIEIETLVVSGIELRCRSDKAYGQDDRVLSTLRALLDMARNQLPPRPAFPSAVMSRWQRKLAESRHRALVIERARPRQTIQCAPGNCITACAGAAR